MLLKENTSKELKSSSTYTALALFLIIFAVFTGTIEHDFVYDDNELILNDQRIQEKGGLQRIFTKPFHTDGL